LTVNTRSTYYLIQFCIFLQLLPVSPSDVWHASWKLTGWELFNAWT